MSNNNEQVKHLENQIDLLAETIIECCPSEIKDGESACEVAARLIREAYGK